MAPAKASATVKTPAAQKGAMNFRPEVEDGADGTSTGLATLMGDRAFGAARGVPFDSPFGGRGAGVAKKFRKPIPNYLEYWWPVCTQIS